MSNEFDRRKHLYSFDLRNLLKSFGVWMTAGPLCYRDPTFYFRCVIRTFDCDARLKATFYVAPGRVFPHEAAQKLWVARHTQGGRLPHVPYRPALEDVVAYVLDDLTSVISTTDFDDYCSSYDLDADSRRVYRQYKRLDRQSWQLQTLLTRDQIDALCAHVNDA